MDNYKNLPIVALTAHAIKGETEKILASGVNYLITKPLDEEQLLGCLSRLLPHCSG
jgi:CheY-like chemotaxis protein